MVHLNISSFIESMSQCFCSYPGIYKDERGSFPVQDLREYLRLLLKIISNESNGNIQLFCYGHLDNREWALTAEEPCNFIRISHRCRKAYPLELPRIHTETFKCNGKL